MIELPSNDPAREIPALPFEGADSDASVSACAEAYHAARQLLLNYKSKVAELERTWAPAKVAEQKAKLSEELSKRAEQLEERIADVAKTRETHLSVGLVEAPPQSDVAAHLGAAETRDALRRVGSNHLERQQAVLEAVAQGDKSVLQAVLGASPLVQKDLLGADAPAFIAKAQSAWQRTQHPDRAKRAETLGLHLGRAQRGLSTLKSILNPAKSR